MYRYVLCLLLILLLFPTLVACGGAWQAGAKEPSAIPNATPTLAEAEAPEQANSPQATPTPASCPSPTAEPQEATPQTGRGLLYVSVEEGTVWLSGEGKPRAIGSLPGDAAYRTLGRHSLAYVSANQIQVLDLTDGTTRTLYDLGERRPGQDFDLRWLDGVREDDEGNESSRLAYAVAWDEPDGSRLVELGLIQGLDRRAVGTVARPAGPTPTSPSIPPVEPGPGFANLKILGYDIHDRLVVTPVGGQERYTALWFYRMDTGKRDETPIKVDAHELALSPDAHRLAIATVGVLHVWALDTDAPPTVLELLPETHARWLTWSPDSERLAYLVHVGASPALDASPAQALEVWEARTGWRCVVEWLDAYAVVHGWTADGKALLLETFDEESGQVGVSLVDVESGQIVELPLPAGASVVGWIGDAWDIGE